MKTKITKYTLAGLIVILGFASWFSIDRAINIPTSSTWLIPIIWFSLFFVALTLGAIIIKEKVILISALGIGFVSGFIFAFSIWHIIAMVFSFFIALAALERIAGDAKLNIKLSPYKSIRVGKAMLILALAIAITFQHFSETKNTEKANIIPKFETGELTSKILPMFFPNIKNNSTEDLTVDEFILEMSKENSDNIMSSFLSDPEMNKAASKIDKDNIKKITNANQQLILQEGRKNLEAVVGQPLTGIEKIFDVFSEMISKKINDIFSPAISESNMPIVSFVISLILFLTIISIGPFLGFIAIYLAMFVFWMLRKFELVKISKVMVEAERID